MFTLDLGADLASVQSKGAKQRESTSLSLDPRAGIDCNTVSDVCTRLYYNLVSVPAVSSSHLFFKWFKIPLCKKWTRLTITRIRRSGGGTPPDRRKQGIFARLDTCKRTWISGPMKLSAASCSVEWYTSYTRLAKSYISSTCDCVIRLDLIELFQRLRSWATSTLKFV